MTQIGFLLTTEVKGKNIQPVEKTANYFLTPVRYLWNGRKVDLIQKEGHKAIQYEYAYLPSERNGQKFLIMVVLLIPGAIIGITLKVYAFFRYHDAEEDYWIERCLIENKPNTIVAPMGEEAFALQINEYQKALSQTVHPRSVSNSNHLFFSEVERVSLLVPDYLGAVSNEKLLINQAVLFNVDLLWNLSMIDLSDYYEVAQQGPEVEKLKTLNCKVSAFGQGWYGNMTEFLQSNYYSYCLMRLKK